MCPHDSPNLARVRVFTFYVDGVRQSKTIPHGMETVADERDRRLNLLFHQWLEAELPGYFEARRVTRISFVDELHSLPGPGQRMLPPPNLPAGGESYSGPDGRGFASPDSR
jgi:hypothetical protein